MKNCNKCPFYKRYRKTSHLGGTFSGCEQRSQFDVNCTVQYTLYARLLREIANSLQLCIYRQK